MRIERLDLTRYGKFTDYSIDFGPNQPGVPDLHIVYGPNEAGKSTALSAMLDLLYGIPTQSSYAFLHPYSNMRIGGQLEIGGISRSFIRIKRPQNSLLDGQDMPVPDQTILGELSGISRDAYRAMFSLDDETLEEGGESILASRGDLGQLLFSASSGLAHFSKTLLDLRLGTDGFFKSGTRSHQLAALRKQLDELRKTRDEIDVRANEFAQLMEKSQRAQASYRQVLAERGAADQQRMQAQRMLDALQPLSDLRALRQQMQGMVELQEFPARWAEDLPLLRNADIEQQTMRAGMVDRIARLSSQLEETAVDQAALDCVEPYAALEDSAARFLTADRDLPDRRASLVAFDRDVLFALRALGRPDEASPEGLLIPMPIVARLREMMEAWSGVESAWLSAQSEAVQARGDLEMLAVHPAEENGATDRSKAMDALAARVAILRDTDRQQRLRQLGLLYASMVRDLAQKQSGLHPWSGTLLELAQLPVPLAGEIADWKMAMVHTAQQSGLRRESIERLAASERRMQVELEALLSSTGLAADADLSRQRRDSAWAAHRRELGPESADAFEKTMLADDAVNHARIAHSSQLATIERLRRDMALAVSDLASERALLSDITEKRQALDAEIGRRIGAMNGPADAPLSLEGLQLWLSRRDAVLADAAKVQQVENDLESARVDLDLAIGALRQALDAAAVAFEAGMDFPALMNVAQAAVDGWAQQKARLKTIDEARLRLAARQKSQAAAEAQRGDWLASWQALCSTLWFGMPEPAPGLGVVKAILEQLEGLAVLLRERGNLLDRIGKMEEDQRQFAREILAISGTLGLEGASSDIAATWRLIGKRVRDAEAAGAHAVRLTRDRLEAEQELAALDARIAARDARKHEMFVHFHVDTLGEVESRIHGVMERYALSIQVQRLARQICELTNASSLEEAEVLLGQGDKASLERDLSSLNAVFTDLDASSREHYSSFMTTKAELDAVGGDSQVARIEEQRRTILLEIEDRALSYLRMRAGILAAELALRSYRDKHQSAMMARASQAFQTVSRGAYQGLRSVPEKDGEILIAIGADGSSKVADKMSKGTRFQLYLALRMAGYYEFALTRGAVPFIADDIMETFDDFRAEEAFKLFGEMAGVGQVIYLTHHAHLCEIAARVCPGVKIHKLQG